MEIQSENHRKSMMSKLQQLKQVPAWNLLTEELQRKKEELEKEVLNSFSINENEKYFSINDIKKVEIQTILLMLDMPDDLIDRLDNIKDELREAKELY